MSIEDDEAMERAICARCDRPRATADEMINAAKSIERWNDRGDRFCYALACIPIGSGCTHDTPTWKAFAVAIDAHFDCVFARAYNRTFCSFCDFLGSSAEVTAHVEQCAAHPMAQWKARALAAERALVEVKS